MTKKTTAAIDFLAAISGETELFEIGGLTVELRSLTFTEVQGLSTKHRNDTSEMAFQALALGMIDPKLDEAQLEQVRGGKPGLLMKIAERVMKISGMIDQEDGGSPLAGTG